MEVQRPIHDGIGRERDRTKIKTLMESPILSLPALYQHGSGQAKAEVESFTKRVHR